MDISEVIMRFAYRHYTTGIQVFLFKMLKFNKPCGYGEIFSESLSNAFQTFLTEEERANTALTKKLKNDVIYCWCKFSALPNEYFLYNFRDLDDDERAEFETDMDRIRSLRKTIDYSTFLAQINDKFNFYKKAKIYFKRDAIKVGTFGDRNAFVEFALQHNHLFCKPLAGSKGKSVKVLDIFSQEAANQEFDVLMGGNWIIEERIVQSPEMAFWNESSVNTVRVPSFLRNNQHTVSWTVMRIGKKGAIIDNAAAGGVIVAVDPKTGILMSDGIDETYHTIECHKELQISFKGWQVPHWEALLENVEMIHRELFPNHVYIAFDFALSDRGWVLVEGNWGQLLYQIVTRDGVRKRFHELIGV